MAAPSAPPTKEPAEPDVASPMSPELQQIMAGLSPEQQDIVKKAMTDAKVLEAIDKITELLAPEVEAQMGSGAPMPPAGGPDEMMFGPRKI